MLMFFVWLLVWLLPCVVWMPFSRAKNAQSVAKLLITLATGKPSDLRTTQHSNYALLKAYKK